MNEQDLERLTPQVQALTRQLLNYLINALAELRLLDEAGATDPARVERITNHVRDAFINISTLKSFTTQV